MRLYILCLIHFVLGVTLTVAAPGLGFIEIIIPLILLCSTYSMDFCFLIFYMVLMINDFVVYGSFVGLQLIQNGDAYNIYNNPNSDIYGPFPMTMIIIWTAFPLLAIIISFYAYREFKGMTYDRMGISGSGYGGIMSSLGRGGQGRGADRRDSDADYRDYEA